MESALVVVGSGLTGATIARLARDAGYSVTVVERRAEVGGNVRDQRHASGIVLHPFGPHFFRTGSDRIWKFVNRFASFRPFAAELKTMVDGAAEDWPVTAEYIERVCGTRWSPAFSGEPANFEEASLAMMPRLVYEKFVRGYTEKQWGVPAASLDTSLATRFEIREGSDRRLKTSAYQGLPSIGYSAFMDAMLTGIDVRRGVDFLAHRSELSGCRLTVFTGPIDEFFGFDLGRLQYRAQRRRHRWHGDIAFKHATVSTNFPDPASGAFIREIEWKRMMPADEAAGIAGTLVTREYPFSPEHPDQYEYPFPSDPNRRLYERYAERARAFPDLLLCGRLGEYRYYDMDQAIARAITLFERRVLPRLTG
ncbi:MAG TPA: FAD-dependent oxidoreductase [Stellaceae bacterium]|nr:FAD-dependent oxidoreductase [Stellaceae bacterium]